MTYAILAAIIVLVAVVSEIRLQRTIRAERLRAIELMAHAIGIKPAVEAARSFGWLGPDDVRSDGDNVQIRLPRWSPRRR